MDAKKISETKSALPRTEAVFKVKYDTKTPSRLDLKKSLAGKLKAKEELTVIKRVQNHYGDKEAEVSVYVYDTEAAMNEVEFKHIIKKNSPKQEEAE